MKKKLFTSGEYIADLFENLGNSKFKDVPSAMAAKLHKDLICAFREIDYMLIASVGYYEEKGLHLTDEPEEQLQLKYRDVDDFKIKGHSYFLFCIFAEVLLSGLLTDSLSSRSRLLQTMSSIEQGILDDEIKFDTEVRFRITATDTSAFDITVATPTRGFSVWVTD